MLRHRIQVYLQPALAAIARKRLKRHRTGCLASERRSPACPQLYSRASFAL